MRRSDLRRAARGSFLTLSELPDAENLWLLSTGTAIGPFLSILKTEEPWRRFSSIVLVHAVRQAEELTYQDQIRQLLSARVYFGCGTIRR